MKWFLVLRMAARALYRNKLRTILTMLGMIIGVAAVISMLAIGTGARQSVAASIAALGTNTLIIMPGSLNTGGVRSGAFGRTTLIPADIVAIRDECSPAVKAATAVTQNGAQVVYQNQNWQTSVTGGDLDYPDIRNWVIATGRYFTTDDIRASAKVCLVGQVIIENLFPGEDPLDKVIRVRSVPLRVVGTLEAKGASAFGQSQDDLILVPYTTAMRRIFHQDYLRSALASARTPEEVEKAREQITALLRQRHRIEAGDDDDFNIRTQAEIAQAADASTKVFTMLFGRHRLGVSAGGRHRHHEHHAGVGHRAGPRDRHPHGPGRAPPGHPLAVPGGVGGALALGRSRGRAVRLRGGAHRRALVPMAPGGLRILGGTGRRLLPGSGDLLRPLPGRARLPPGPHPGSAQRVGLAQTQQARGLGRQLVGLEGLVQEAVGVHAAHALFDVVLVEAESTRMGILDMTRSNLSSRRIAAPERVAA